MKKLPREMNVSTNNKVVPFYAGHGSKSSEITTTQVDVEILQVLKIEIKTKQKASMLVLPWL